MLKKKDKGFTLIEIITVISIIVLLTGLGIPAYKSWQGRARKEKAKATIEKIAMAIEMYKREWGYYPQGDDLNNPVAVKKISQFLSAYMTFKSEDMGTSDGQYNPNGSVLLDPWGNYYGVLTYPGSKGRWTPAAEFSHNKKTYYVYSRGPDGMRGNDCIRDFSTNDPDNDNIDNYYPL